MKPANFPARKLAPYITLIWSDPSYERNLGVISQEITIDGSRDEWIEAVSDFDYMIGRWSYEKALLIDPTGPVPTITDVTKRLLELVAAKVDPHQFRDEASDYDELICRTCDEHGLPIPIDRYSPAARRETDACFAAHMRLEA